MSGFLDFLFNGNPPPATTTTTSTSVPQWMQEYTRSLLSSANQVAGAGYQTYQGPRLAGFTPTQQGAFDLARNNVGSAQPLINGAIQIGQNLPGSGALEQAMQYLPQDSKSYPEVASQYTNPYTESVVDKAKNDALRTWSDQIQPGIEGQFVRNGAFGSSAMARVLGSAGANVTQQVQDSSNAARAAGWESGANIYNQDVNRQGQLAQIASGIGATAGNLGIQQAGLLSNLGADLQRANANDAASLGAVGDAEQAQNQKNLDIGYKDFTDQRDYDRNQINWLSGLLNGSTSTTPQTTTNVGPASSYQPSGLAQIAAILSAYKGITGGNNQQTTSGP